MSKRSDDHAAGNVAPAGGVRRSLLPWLTAVLWPALLPQPALAHITQGPIGGFAGGFAHPLTGLDHFLAMFAVGVWGAQMGGRSVWALPVAFPLVMTTGGIAGMAGLVLPYVEIGIALSILVLGLAIACKWRPAEIVPLALIAIFALCHGYAHGVELPSAADPAAYAAGFVLATGMIHIIGIGSKFVVQKRAEQAAAPTQLFIQPPASIDPGAGDGTAGFARPREWGDQTRQP
jgi:urease accessory protein